MLSLQLSQPDQNFSFTARNGFHDICCQYITSFNAGSIRRYSSAFFEKLSIVLLKFDHKTFENSESACHRNPQGAVVLAIKTYRDAHLEYVCVCRFSCIHTVF